MRRSWPGSARLRFLVAFLSTVVIAVACRDGGGGPPVGRSPTVLPGPLSPGPALAQPPPARASAGGVSVALGLGSYCWSSGAGLPGVCLDKLGLVTGDQTLVVDRGGGVSVANPATDPLASAVVSAIPATGRPTRAGSELVWPLDGSGGAALAPVVASGGLSFPADLGPGRWVVRIQLFFGGGRDVVYGLLLEVR